MYQARKIRRKSSCLARIILRSEPEKQHVDPVKDNEAIFHCMTRAADSFLYRVDL